MHRHRPPRRPAAPRRAPVHPVARGLPGRCVLAVGLLVACPLIAPRAPAAAALPVIADIRPAASNLALSVLIPEGAQEAVVEASETMAAGSWQPVQSRRVTGGGAADFDLPKPGARMFFRVRARATPLFPEAASDPVSYQVAPVVQKRNKTTGPEVLELSFRFRLDGSDKIRVTRDGILWEHVNWAWPGTDVSVNGVRWQPRLKNVLMSAGPEPFLPADASFLGAQVEVSKGRDTVVLERAEDALLILVDDTPKDADEYEFKVTIPKARRAPKSHGHGAPDMQLHIAAEIDGSDQLVITQEKAEWKHLRWRWPSWVTFNDYDWNPKQKPALTNAAECAFPFTAADLSSCEVLEREGRDLCVVETLPSSVVVHFADNPNSTGLYRLTLGFRKRAQPAAP